MDNDAIKRVVCLVQYFGENFATHRFAGIRNVSTAGKQEEAFEDCLFAKIPGNESSLFCLSLQRVDKKSPIARVRLKHGKGDKTGRNRRDKQEALPDDKKKPP